MKKGILELVFHESEIDKTAIVHRNKKTTYKDLYDLAKLYLNYFKSKRIEKKIICVICKRSTELIACVLGIVGSGNAYMVYEPDDITESIMTTLRSMDNVLILGEERIKNIQDVVLMERIKSEKYMFSGYCERKENDLLYLVSTSGTTKNGKLIMVEDRNFLCYLQAYINYFAITGSDVIIQQSPVYYDGFAEEVFSVLTVGGTLVLMDSMELKNPRKIAEIIDKNSVSIFPSTPLMLNEINKLDKLPSVRAFISSGDVLRKKQISNIVKDSNVYNMYGVSETTVCATCYKCSVSDKEIIPIGKELEGYEIVICDELGKEVLGTDVGEIYIMGTAVTRGYYENLGKNTEYDTFEGQRVYKTGDFGWRDETGDLHYLGRKDRQIKIRGNKVNLNQIEKCLMEINGVEGVAVVACEDRQVIYAFFVGDSCDIREIRKSSQKMLPYYMRPTQYIMINQIPIGRTGKTDYKQLLNEYSVDNKTEIINEEQCSNLEKTIIEKIINLLTDKMPVFSISLENTWDEIGLDSLLYINLIVEIEKNLGIELNDDILFQGQFTTIKEFCDAIDRVIKNKIEYGHIENIGKFVDR